VTAGVGPAGYRLGYRADVEGLRAVAIGLVVACHAQVTALAGGFVGVDVFYVLSGYLITGLLVQEIQTTGTLRFANFYVRRLRRLLPALLLMLTIVCVLGRLLLAASDQAGQALAATSAALWLSNFHFAFASLGYFDPDAAGNLFLHTWSLGVEEQFYLVWPLLIVLVAGAWSKIKPPSIEHLKYAFIAVFVLALALSLYWTWHAPRLAFYMMPSRAWQFALGALAFLAVGTPNFRVGAVRLPATWSAAAGWIGLALVIGSALWLTGAMPYPGYWALAPTVGTALLLVGGAQRGGRATISHWLSARPLQAIGRISYAWYLWHWPVLLLGAQLIDGRNPWNRLLLVGISLALAALSYHLFETPIRHWRAPLLKPRMAAFVGLAIMLLAGSFALRWHQAARVRMQGPEQQRFVQAHLNAPVIYGMGCDQWFRSADLRLCSFGDPKAAHTAVAFGDSVALQWFPAYARLFDRPGWRLLVLTKSACPMVDAPIFYARIGREYTVCAQWRRRALREIAALKPEVVIVGSTFGYHYTKAQWIAGTRAVLQRLASAAGTVYLMRSTPILPFDGPDCMAPRSRLYADLRGRARCTAPADSALGNAIATWLRTAAAPFGNVHFIDMTNAICPDDVCHAELDGHLVYRDNQHMTATFAASLAPALAQALHAAAGGDQRPRETAPTPALPRTRGRGIPR
jgi:peptidoglycan/LPS O-acetylase OafA/YrhL